MAESRNPYAPPTAHVADPSPAVDDTDVLIPNGHRVPFGNGYRWLSEAMRLFRLRPGKWIVILLILVVVLIVSSLVPFLSFFGSLFWPVLSGGLMLAAHKVRRSGNFDLGDLFAGARSNPGQLALVGLVVLLMVPIMFASVSVFVGTDVAKALVLHIGKIEDPTRLASTDYYLAILVYFALILPIAAATYLATPLIMLNGLTAGAAMKMSFIGSLKNILPSLLFGVCGVILLLLSMIPLGLGLLFSVPVLMISSYTMYRDIFIEGA